MIVRAGLAAFPYLSRLGEWEAASVMLEQATKLDLSPGTIAAALPLLQRVVEATAETDRALTDRGVLAHVLLEAGRVSEAETLLREVIAQSVERGAFAGATAAAGGLVNVLRDTGRFEAALQVVEEKMVFRRQAGHGPWSQLADEAQRLQVLAAMGEHAMVLDRVAEIRAGDARLFPDPPDENDGLVAVWNVRETVLDIGRDAASELEKWQEALELSAEQLRIMEKRGAAAVEQARFRFADYGPLLRLGNDEEARSLLLDCRRVFEQQNAIEDLGRVFSALADLEDKLGHTAAAAGFEDTALRYKYTRGSPAGAAISHFNLANYLRRLEADWRSVLAHRMAAILIDAAMRAGGLAKDIAALARNLRAAADRADAALPADLTGLCAIVEQIEGVRFRDLMIRLEPDENRLNELMQAIIATAKELMDEPSPNTDPKP